MKPLCSGSNLAIWPGDEMRLTLTESWWTWTGSNRRPLPCHGSDRFHASDRNPFHLSESFGSLVAMWHGLWRGLRRPAARRSGSDLDVVRANNCGEIVSTNDLRVLAEQDHSKHATSWLSSVPVRAGFVREAAANKRRECGMDGDAMVRGTCLSVN